MWWSVGGWRMAAAGQAVNVYAGLGTDYLIFYMEYGGSKGRSGWVNSNKSGPVTSVTVPVVVCQVS